jgi:hypothetical protein
MHYNALSPNNGKVSNNSLKSNGFPFIVLHYLKEMH